MGRWRERGESHFRCVEGKKAHFLRPLARGQEVQYQMRGCGLIEEGIVIDAGYHVILVGCHSSIDG
jgi:hypothetical protein